MQKEIKRILEISHKHKLSHLGSCLTALPIIYNIYQNKKEEDIFVLSNGHAGLALYVVLESKYGVNAEELLIKNGIHPCRDKYISCSTGSLGCGLPIAVGFAIAGKTVYCLISDGECAEGSIWEALNCKEKYNLTNLHVHVNMNGYSAYDKISPNLKNKLLIFCPDIVIHETKNDLPFLNGIDAHYHVMTEEEFHLNLTSG